MLIERNIRVLEVLEQIGHIYYPVDQRVTSTRSIGKGLNARLIVVFENSTWELIYTRDTDPKFKWKPYLQMMLTAKNKISSYSF